MKGKTTPLLRDVPDNKCFRTTAGQVFRSYAELLDGLKRMDDHVFAQHVNDSRNDFRNWVRDVYSDDKLARDFSNRPTRIGMAQAVAQRLRNLALRH